MSDKIRPQHVARKAILYVRQSSAYQVAHNLESQRLQYAMRDRLQHLGCREISRLSENVRHLNRGKAYGVFDLLEFRVLRFRLRQSRHIGVGVLPQRQEVLVRRSSGRQIPCGRQRPRFLQSRAGAGRVAHHQSRMVEDLLKLRHRLLRQLAGGVRSTTDVDRVQASK
jgi:hypothetical protein